MGFLGDRRLRRAGRDDHLSVVDHLDELRNRLIVSGITLVVAFAVAYAFHDQLITFLEKPLPDRYQETGLITLSPTEPFFTTLKVCFWAAIIVSLPVWLYQLYAFVIPAVEDQSRRKILTIVGAIAALFLAGVAFTFYVVLPVALQFLLDFGQDTFLTQVRAGEYFGFVTTLMLAGGLMFEVPIAMVGVRPPGARQREPLHQAVAGRAGRDRRPGGDPSRRRPVQHAAADGPPDRPVRPGDPARPAVRPSRPVDARRLGRRRRGGDPLGPGLEPVSRAGAAR